MGNRMLFGRYNLIEVIGQGGMGTVYLAEDITTNENYAIKEVSAVKRGKEFILREPLLLKKINHQSIVKVKEIFDFDNKIYIVMDYIEGLSLKEALIKDKKFPEKQVINWTIQICKALEYLHNQEPYPIVYRDIKPSNIIVDKDDKITIIDFGIACEYREEEHEENFVALTKGYCAPEQYIEKTFDLRSDIYSLGVTMQHLLTGVSPTENYFETTPIKQFNENISREIEYIVTKATRIDPDERYQCIEDMCYDLENIEKLQQDLRRIVVTQIISYAGFFCVYLVFGFLIYFGYRNLKSESLNISEGSIMSGYDEMTNGNYEVAFTDFNEAIKLNPYSLEGYKAIFEYYERTAEYADGISYIRNNTENFEVITRLEEISTFYMGKYYYKMGMYREALHKFKDVYKWNSEDKNNLFYANLCYFKLEESPQKDLISEFVNLGGTEDELAFLYAEKFSTEKNFSQAIAEFDNVIQKTNNKFLLADAYVSKANLYKDNQNSFGKSMDLYIMTLEEGDKKLGNHKDIRIYLMKSEEYRLRAAYAADENEEAERIKNTNLALDNYRKLIAIGKNDPLLYSETFMLYISLENYDAAEQIVLEATQKYTDNFKLHYYLTIVQYRMEFEKPKQQRDYTKAEKTYEKTKELGFKENRNSEINELGEEIDNYV